MFPDWPHGSGSSKAIKGRQINHLGLPSLFNKAKKINKCFSSHFFEEKKQVRQAGCFLLFFFVCFFISQKTDEATFFILSKPNEAPFLFILSIKMLIF